LVNWPVTTSSKHSFKHSTVHSRCSGQLSLSSLRAR